MNESKVLGSTEMSHDKFYFYCGSSIMNEIQRVAVQGFGRVNILANSYFDGRLVRWWTLLCRCHVL